MAQSAEREVRNLANYAFITLLIFGEVYMLLTPLILNGVMELYGLIGGVVILALEFLGVFTALTVWKPRIVDAINQGRYAEAYQVASDPLQLIIGLLYGVVPFILLYLTQQKLASIVGQTTPPPLETRPPLVPAKLICKYCGAENPFYLIYCMNCGRPLREVKGQERTETQVKEPEKTETEARELTNVEKELALLNDWLSKLEELYRRGEVEEEAYKKLKEEYENRKRELEKSMKSG